jgi:uncharacterized protein (TIGR03435 family)
MEEEMATTAFATAFLMFAAVGSAQNDPTSTPPATKFDVASIKPAAPDSRGMFIRNMPGGRLKVTNMTLKMLIEIAYRLQSFQISGASGWMESLHYDIDAKPDSPAKQSDGPAMLQGLLADRFQLVFHRETKELPIYALVLAHKGGKLGPGMTEMKEGSCTPFDPSKPPPSPGKGPALSCGTQFISPRSVTAIAVPVANLVPMLSRILGRTVIDKTGLTGRYDMKMEFTPDDSQLAMMAPPGAPPPPPPDSSSAPSLFTALQEQLGLKLESQKGPVEILVIDRAEKPSEN